MKKHNANSIQNRFTAYLLTAVVHQRMRYMEKKKSLLRKEALLVDQEIKKYLNLKTYQICVGEQTEYILKEWEKFQEFMLYVEDNKLIKALNKLKDREQKLLFARVFGEMTFEEIGRKANMKPKQVEMAYYYILRKLRKELEVKK